MDPIRKKKFRGMFRKSYDHPEMVVNNSFKSSLMSGSLRRNFKERKLQANSHNYFVEAI